MNKLAIPAATRIYTLKKTESNPYADTLDTIRLQLELCHYQEQTIKAYMGQLCAFINHIQPMTPDAVSSQMMTAYINSLTEVGAARSTVDQAITALDYLSRELLHEPLDANALKRPPKAASNPVLLTADEVAEIAMSAENPKHRLMIELMSSAGLRVSEIVNVRVTHLNLDKGILYVPGNQRIKSRTTQFDLCLQDALSRQIGKKEKDDYLFPSEKGGRLTTRSVAKFFKAALLASNIQKDATPHSLRQSFTESLVEKGLDPISIQQILGRATL
ncbi:MAG: tyrosine-type recombinase/integrase [Candidatus Nitrohelix vancouverensis]|uniref:Tyrosine-type recombinase/integrase n=1 Tax=Candidatus Nitrohelix vancouverensis TaxID=2705534 RepID=A0A7T0C1T9_9BACT|nr:MAG: tyrosine-type recombinase/integrase [Candidatus Nitrohelix vancouverensis]